MRRNNVAYHTINQIGYTCLHDPYKGALVRSQIYIVPFYIAIQYNTLSRSYIVVCINNMY